MADPSFQDLIAQYDAWRVNYLNSSWTPDFLLLDRIAPLDKDRADAFAAYAAGNFSQALVLIKAAIVAAGMDIHDSTQNTSGAGGVQDLPTLGDDLAEQAKLIEKQAADAAAATWGTVKTVAIVGGSLLALVLVVVVVVKVSK